MHSHSAGSVLAAVVAGLVFAVVGAWHLRPWLTWHLTVAPRLSMSADGGRLHVEDLHTDPETPGSWPLLEVADFSLRAPIASISEGACLPCMGGCRLPLRVGTLAVFEHIPPESYADAIDLMAPDASDISLFRTAARNWNTIEALAGRAEFPDDGQVALRFASEHSRGLTVAMGTPEAMRFVIYAFGSDGRATRLLALSGVDRTTLEQVLGSLEIDASKSQSTPAHCAAGTPWPVVKPTEMAPS